MQFQHGGSLTLTQHVLPFLAGPPGFLRSDAGVLAEQNRVRGAVARSVLPRVARIRCALSSNVGWPDERWTLSFSDGATVPETGRPPRAQLPLAPSTTTAAARTAATD